MKFNSYEESQTFLYICLAFQTGGHPSQGYPLRMLRAVLHVGRKEGQAEMLSLQRGDQPFNIRSLPTNKVLWDTQKEMIEGGHETIFAVLFFF